MSHAFIFSRDFAIEPAQMYALWSEPDALVQWFGPANATIEPHALELRVDGRYHFAMHTPDGKTSWGLWVFTSIEPGRQLAWRHSFSDAAGGLTRHPLAATWPLVLQTTVTFEAMEGSPHCTRVTLRWQPVDASEAEQTTFDASHESMRAGWTNTFDQLSQYVERLQHQPGSKLTPCIWFDGHAEEAAQLYTSLVGDSKIVHTARYSEGMPMPAGTVMLVEFTVGGQLFQALNGGPLFRPNPSLSFFLQFAGRDEAQRVFERLAEGGKVLMPLDSYPWSACYAWVEDRFGVSWQILVGTHGVGAPLVVACFMFSGQQQGLAQAAIEQYTQAFGGRVERIERYVEGEGPVGSIKHGRFSLAGQEFVAMDSHSDNAVPFTEGLSLSVRCADQSELNHLWEALTDGGSPGRCGWLKDRFGVSWQLVPDALVRLQKSGDPTANGRMFQAMLTMTRLDVAALERAHRGE